MVKKNWLFVNNKREVEMTEEKSPCRGCWNEFGSKLKCVKGCERVDGYKTKFEHPGAHSLIGTPSPQKPSGKRGLVSEYPYSFS